MAGKSLPDTIREAQSRHALRRASVLNRHEETMSKIIYKPRGDFVLFRAVKSGLHKGIAMPDSAAEDERYYVVAVGPKVEGLKEGDEVFALGRLRENWMLLPGTRDLVITRETNIALVIERPEE